METIIIQEAGQPAIIVNPASTTAAVIVTERNGRDGSDGADGSDGTDAIYKTLVYTEFDGETNYVNTTIIMQVDAGLSWTAGQRGRLSKLIGSNLMYIEGYIITYYQNSGNWYLRVRCDAQITGISTYTAGTCYWNLIGHPGAGGQPGAEGPPGEITDEITLSYLLMK